MIFPPQQARAIANGKVSALRIPARRGKAGAPYARIPFKVAHDIPVHSSADRERPKCHIRVVSKHREPHSVSLLDARAAGYRTSSEYMQAWVRRYDRAWIAKHKVDLAAAFGDEVVPYILGRRFEERWLGAEVWVVRFALVDDTLYYLAQPNPLREQDDYTTVPGLAIDPLPVVDRARQEKYAKHAEEKRKSFKRDLEMGRQKRRNERRDLLFERAA